VPIVFTETQDGEPFEMVDVDQVGIAKAATEHLIELGHRKIAHIAGNQDWLAANRRKSGYLTTMAKHSFKTIAITQGDWTPKSGYEAAQLLLEGEKFTAIFVANDAMAIGALRALSEDGLRVPEDVSLVSVDDSAESEYMQPALTSVRQQFDLVGAALLTKLLNQIEGVSTSGPKRKLIPGILTSRESAIRI
jgi:DNA-binding LacI/PurR family transcriptional regulator